MNVGELKQRLAQRAESVAAILLPKGKRVGGEWKAGSISGEPGDSLSVNIRGQRAGVWADFATGEGGDLIDLWSAVRGTTLTETLDQVRSYLGVTEPKFTRPERQYRRPERPTSRSRNPAVREWLVARGLTDETVAAFRVAEDGDMVMLPYLRDGELVNIKRRSIVDKKRMLQEKDAEPCLFGWHLIDPNARTVAITEGEFDAMVLHQMGIPALSVPAGAGNHQWIENDWTRLDRFERIDLCFDADDAGRKGLREVATRLGIERCRSVTFGDSKDANDYLLAGASREDFLRSVAAGKTEDPDELVGVEAYVDSVLEMFNPQAGVSVDPPLVVGEEEDWFRFRRGEVTVWTGYNGHGKSMALGLVQLGLMEFGERFCVYSGELSPQRLLYRMTRQCVGMPNPTISYARRAMDWMADKVWVFAVEGNAHSKRLFEVFRYAARRYGVSHVVIDSLMMLEDVPEDGRDSLERQRQFMVKAVAFAKEHRVHVHLVAHPRKGDDERHGPGKQDVAGSGKITNMADNVISVWSKLEDENAEKKVDENGEELDPPNTKLEVHKQRNGDVQHKSVWGWFDTRSYQICRKPDRRPRRFPREEA